MAGRKGQPGKHAVDELARGRRAPYTLIGVWVILAPVSVYAKAVYALLAAHVNASRGDSAAWPSQVTMALVLRCSQPTISRAVAELVALGALEKECKLSTGQWRYLVHEAPPEGYEMATSTEQLYDMLREWAAEAVDNSADGLGTPGPREGSASGYSPQNSPDPQVPSPAVILPSIDPHSPGNIHRFPGEYKSHEVNDPEDNHHPSVPAVDNGTARTAQPPRTDGRTEPDAEEPRNWTPAEQLLADILATVDSCTGQAGHPSGCRCRYPNVGQRGALVLAIAGKMASGWTAESLLEELTSGLESRFARDVAATLLWRLRYLPGPPRHAAHTAGPVPLSPVNGGAVYPPHTFELGADGVACGQCPMPRGNRRAHPTDLQRKVGAS